MPTRWLLGRLRDVRQFLKRLKEIREHEWNNYDIKIWEEYGDTQKGVREDETALEAIARHMVEVLGENK